MRSAEFAYFSYRNMASTTRELVVWRCDCDVRTLVEISNIFLLISDFTAIERSEQ